MSTINAVFISLFLSYAAITFLPEGFIVGVWNFAWGLNSQKNKIWGEQKFRGPRGVEFLFFPLKYYKEIS